MDRHELAALFWVDSSASKAKQSLRALLYQAKREPLGRALEVETRRVRLAIDTDVQRFAEAMSAGDWRMAVDAYAGTFLDRVPGDESATFEAWLEETRDELHRSWRDAALHVAEEQQRVGRARDAVALLTRVLAYDFLDEEAVQACMRAHASMGHRTRALELFDAFRERLGAELDMTPLSSSWQVAEAIRHAVAVAPDRAPGPDRVMRTEASAVPRPLTPFVGRLLDLLELDNLLARPDVRLITLMGPGGVGKSRLSLELLEGHRLAFEDGAVFVALEGVHAAADVASAVASALGLELVAERSPADAVVRHVRSRNVLVVLDNLEHLIAGAAAFVRRLLDAAPRCVVLCTSTTVLGLAGEVVYDLAGLTVPSSPQDRDLETYDAVRLFVASARRARSDFVVTEADRAHLVRLCVLLDGLPLALELAASWVRLYRLRDLVDVLERDLDLLTSPGIEVNERHRSLRVVFDHSWRLLDDAQQRLLSTLAVFDGGFDLGAVAAVGNATTKTLLALIDRSLVRRSASGRFSLLLVVRQYAAERSTSDAGDRERHAMHYLGLVERAGVVLNGVEPSEALRTLQEDLDNIRAAWRWGCEQGRIDLCDRAIEPLNVFFTGRALLHEGDAFFRLALDRLGDRSSARFRARLHHQLAFFARRQDRHAAADEHARLALQLAEDLPDAEELTIDCLCELAITSCWTGRFADAASSAERALAHADELGEPDRVARCTSVLALAKRYEGRFDEALRLYREVLSYERRRGRLITLVRALSDVGRLWVDLRRPHEAEALFREGMDLATRHDLPYEVGFMWEGLSHCSYLRSDLDQAEQRVEAALKCTEAVGDQVGIAIQSADLARILVARGEPDRARPLLRTALSIAWERLEVPEVLKHFLTWAVVSEEDRDLTVTLLGWVARHPAAQAVSRDEALGLLAERKLSPPPVDLSASALHRVVSGLLGTTH